MRQIFFQRIRLMAAINGAGSLNTSRYCQYGFTLIEIMIVIALIAALSFFTVKYSGRKFGDQLVDRSASQVVNIKRAALNYFTTAGHWPDAANNCAGAADVLRPFIGQNMQNSWGHAFIFGCPSIQITNTAAETESTLQSSPSFIIRQQVPSLKSALQLARHLPATDVDQDNSINQNNTTAFFVETFVPMVLMPKLIDTADEIRIEQDGIYVPYHKCANNTFAEIIIIPKQICATGDQFYGYRAGTSIDHGAATSMPKVVAQVLNSSGVWVDAFTACNISYKNYRELFSVHQLCKA